MFEYRKIILFILGAIGLFTIIQLAKINTLMDFNGHKDIIKKNSFAKTFPHKNLIFMQSTNYDGGLLYVIHAILDRRIKKLPQNQVKVSFIGPFKIPFSFSFPGKTYNEISGNLVYKNKKLFYKPFDSKNPDLLSIDFEDIIFNCDNQTYYYPNGDKKNNYIFSYVDYDLSSTYNTKDYFRLYDLTSEFLLYEISCKLAGYEPFINYLNGKLKLDEYKSINYYTSENELIKMFKDIYITPSSEVVTSWSTSSGVLYKSVYRCGEFIKINSEGKKDFIAPHTVGAVMYEDACHIAGLKP
jgi:hypothetical protein